MRMDSTVHQLVVILTMGFYISFHNLESHLNSLYIQIIPDSGFMVALSFDMFVVLLLLFVYLIIFSFLNPRHCG